jgi:aspartate/methionine/tyrosine aminotransferase
VRIRDNLENLPASGIALLLHVGENRDILSLGIGEPDFETPSHIVEAAIESLRRGDTHYTPDPGTSELRDAIMNKTKRDNGFDVNPESEVMVTAGTSPGVFGAIFGSVNKSDEIIIPTPAYLAYEPIIRIAEAKPVTVPGPEEASFVPTADEIAEAITKKTRMIIICSPNNPTGGVWNRESVKAVSDLAVDHDLLILSDELYEKLVYDDVKITSPAAFSGMFERTITINGLSKSHAMTGFRLGWVIGPQEIIAGFKKIHQYSTICAPATSQAAGVAALNGPQECVKEMVEEYDRRRKLLVSRINKEVPFISTTLPKGSFFLMANVQELLETHEKDMRNYFKNDGKAFLEQIPDYLFRIEDFDKSGSLLTMMYLASAAKVLTASGASFGSGGEGFLRLSYAQKYEKINKAVDRIIATLEPWS